MAVALVLVSYWQGWRYYKKPDIYPGTKNRTLQVGYISKMP